jgi:hypothetical protein
MSAPQPLTGDELATIKARAEDTTTPEAWTHTMREACYALHARRDVPRLVAEVERLQAQVKRVEALLGLYDSWDGRRPHPGESSPRQRDDLRTALDGVS